MFQTDQSKPKRLCLNFAQEIIRLLHFGVDRGFNPRGDFANLCRAIVNKTREDDAWVFSKEFEEKRGLKPQAAVVSPRSTYK